MLVHQMGTIIEVSIDLGRSVMICRVRTSCANCSRARIFGANTSSIATLALPPQISQPLPQ